MIMRESLAKLQHAAREDYTALSSTVEFLPGETQKQITVEISNDKRIEEDERFQLDLTGGVGVHVSPLARTEITIENDDG